jgi:hypothetical protein
MKNMKIELGFDLEHTQSQISWPAVTAPSPAALLGRWGLACVIATGIWSIVELPVELWGADWGPEMVACLLGKAVWLGIIVGVLCHIRAATLAYTFLCALGVAAIGVGLPVELRYFPLGFGVSAIECGLKAMAFVAVLYPTLPRSKRG